MAFREVPYNLFKDESEAAPRRNHLAFRIQPNEGIVITVNAKKPGPGMELGRVHIEFDYEEGPKGPFVPVLRNLVVEDLVCQHAERPMVVRAYAKADISGVTIRNCDFRQASAASQIAFVKDLKVLAVRVNGAPSTLT